MRRLPTFVGPINGLADPHRLQIGQRLRMSNRHIVPATRRAAGVMDRIDPTGAERVLRDTWGIAVDVSKKPDQIATQVRGN